MTILFMDGFDLYADLADAAKGGLYYAGANQGFSTSLGRKGGGCLTNTVSNTGHAVPAVVSQGDAVIIAFAYYVGNRAGSGSADPIIQGADRAGTLLFRLAMNASGDLMAYNNANTQVGSTASGAMSDASWHWIEVKALLGTDATTGSIEVRVNDIVVIGPVATIDTFSSTGLHLAYINLIGSAGGGRFDDVVVMDDNGATMNDFIGDSFINTFSPNSDGSVADWTASAGSVYQTVDETPSAANDDTDYAHSVTAAQVSELQMSNFVDNPPNATVVQIRTRSSKPNAGPRTYRANLISGATTSDGLTLGFTLGYAWRRNGFWPLNPHTSATWTKSGVNAAKVELELIA